MADKTYTITYRCNNSDALAKTQAMTKALHAMNAELDKLEPRIKTLFTGPSRSAGNAAQRFDQLATSIKNVGSAASAAEGDLTGMSSSLKASGGAAGGAVGNFGGIASAAAGLAAARQAIDLIAAGSEAIEKKWAKIAADSTEFRDSLREYSSLKGAEGPTDAVAAGVLRTGLKIGAAPDAARDFLQAYENVGPAVRQKQHYQPGPGQGTPEELEKRVVDEAGRTARRLGIEAGPAGEAIGTMGLFHRVESVEGAMEQFGGALKGLSEGKVSYTAGVRALSEGSSRLLDPREAAGEGAVAGKLGSYREAGIYMGALSLGTGSAAQARTRMVQISRILNPDLTKHPEAGEALANAGVTPQMTDPQKLITLGKFLKAQGVQDPQKWLSENGLQAGRIEATEATVAGLKQVDVLEQRLKAAAESAKTGATGKAVIAGNERFMKTDKAAAAAQVGAIAATTDVAKGLQGVAELNAAKAAAEQRFRLSDPANYNSPHREAYDSINNRLSLFTYGVSGEGHRQEFDERFGAYETLAREGAKVGVDVRQQAPGLFGWRALGTSIEQRAAMFSKAAEAVRAVGGDPLGLGDLNAQANREIDAAAAVATPGARAAVGAAADGKALGVQQEQLQVLKRIEAGIRAPAAAARIPVGPIVPDIDPAGPRRAGG